MRRSRLACVSVGLLLAGTGCFSQAPETPTTTPAPNPKSATERVQFLAGDSFEIRQTFLGLGGSLPDVMRSKSGVRLVNVRRFAPMQSAELVWNLTSDEATADQEKKGIVLAKVSTSGTVTGINLATPHLMNVPATWTPGARDLRNEGSAIWLSDDAFLELSRTKKTTLNFGITDEATSRIVKNLTELRAAWDTLRTRVTQESRTRDLSLLEADSERIDYPIKINGQDAKVSAWRAHNGFGEVIVLDNRQNPLVLKLTLNPVFAGAADIVSGDTGLKALFGFEVANLTVTGF